MKVYLTRTQSGLLPYEPDSEDWYRKLKLGQVIRGEFKKVRNYGFLRKYFALLNIGFDNWEPGEINSKYGIPEKNFSRFRADLTILAGFYENTIRIDGSVRIEPKSISFAKMSAEDFSDLYSKTIDVLIKHVYRQKIDADRLNEIVEQYLRFG